MLSLKARSAQMGPTINDRTEMHGDEPTPALDLSISEFIVTQDELDDQFQVNQPHRFFDKAKPPTPYWPTLEPFVIAHKLEGVSVRLLLGIDQHEVHLLDCKLKGIVLTPLTGGLIALDFKVQHSGDIEDEDLGRLRQAKGHEISIVLEGGTVEVARKKSQPELDLDHDADDQPTVQ